MPRRRTACQRCAAIKTSCDKQQPCSRCKRLSLSCSYRPGGLKEAVVGKPRTRAVHTRSTHSCASCFRRRKKCDEQTPVCGDCSRLGLRCIPRRRETALHDTPPSLCSQLSSRSSPCDESNPSQVTREASTLDPRFGVRQDSPVSIANRLLDPINQQATTAVLDWMQLIEDDGCSDLARRTNLNNSSAMVNQQPKAKDCEIPGLAILLPIMALDNLTGATSSVLNGWSVVEKYLLNHFLQVVSRALVVVHDEQNPFLSEILPMAFTSRPIRHAIVALAACHVSKLYPDFQENIFSHRSLALQGLKEELETKSGIEKALATTLILCLLEICEGNSRKWLLHLHGAKALMSPLKHRDVKPPLRFLFELYTFIHCAITIIPPSPTFCSTEFLTSLNIQFDVRQNQKIHPLYGVAQELYKALSLINKLASTRSSRTASAEDESQFVEEATKIELQLQSWTPDEYERGEHDLRETTAAALAMQWAALLRLHQVVHGNDTSHPRVQPATERLFSALSIIRPGSRIEAHLLFPLLMAGLGSTTKANRLTVEYRLNIMETTIGFGNITGVHRVLDSVWHRMNTGEKNVDWELLMQTDYPGLVLL